MSRVLKILCSRFFRRAATLSLMAIGVAACSAHTSRSNSNPDATGSISQMQTTNVTQPHRNSRLLKHSIRTPTSPTTARPAVAPQITGSVARKPASYANGSRHGGMTTMVAAGETVNGIARVTEAASTEPYRAQGDFAARWPDLSQAQNLEARAPAAINASHGEQHEPMGAQEEMPVLTEAERAEFAEPGQSKLAFVAAALAIALLFAGAIIRLARRHD